MNWEHVQLIFARELRDQFRDRRTMFTIAVLPLLLYPLMGMLMLQITQFHREHPVRISVIGNEFWPDQLPLFDGHQLAKGFLEENESKLVQIEPETLDPTKKSISQQLLEESRNRVFAGETDLVLVIHPDTVEQLAKLRDQSSPLNEGVSPSSTGSSFLTIVGNRANDRSMIADRRIRAAIETWQRHWVSQKLNEANINKNLVQPLAIGEIDVAPAATRSALVWSKLLPFVMLVWALTGAFYPAVDLCAGEKERGTLETLLSSPVRRKEIVWGKLLTVMCFSVSTALLNLVSMQVTASLVMRQFSRLGTEGMFESLGPLPFSSIGWLIIMLLPISALFSALAMAVAALARSSKEGQYYLMPLLLVGMPLVMLPMLPGVTLSVGTSIVPVTGAVLLSRALVEGQYHEAIIHLPFVVAVTAIACLLAIRWAVRQFESETVMFRENERFDLHTWLRQVWRDRGETASASEAVLCGMIILVALFFGRMMASEPTLEWASIAKSTLIIQIGMILAPCLIMATMLTRSLRISLRIHRPRLSDLAFCVMLAICLHPTYVLLASWVQKEYAIGADTKTLLQQFDALIGSAPLWSVIFFLAVVPAICEELAFRGFIFGGLLRRNGVVRAIVVSSLFFGMSHGVLQQTITASLMGLVIGVIAWRSGGVFCGIAFHVTHNSLSMWLSRAARQPDGIPSWCHWAFIPVEGGWDYSPTWTTFSILLAVVGFAWFFARERDFTLRSSPSLSAHPAEA